MGYGERAREQNGAALQVVGETVTSTLTLRKELVAEIGEKEAKAAKEYSQ